MKNVSALTTYFSHSGNTRVVAHQIHESVGGDIVEIVPVDPYPREYNMVVEQARKELSENHMPALRTTIESIQSFNAVFVGYPNWWGTIPMPVAAFLSAYDFSGLTIAPFCTHEGSGMGRSGTDIKKLCPQTTILDGLAIRGSEVQNAKNAVARWLREMAMIP